ncbi:hypothetical protein [Shimia biformata]|uniref:hypothetical protein n=1 Tax=Shimia biformata TaxID=1294299 RepID=UPI0019529D01|nr:hypothetical protein [Shimia biformata]
MTATGASKKDRRGIVIHLVLGLTTPVFALGTYWLIDAAWPKAAAFLKMIIIFVWFPVLNRVAEWASGPSTGSATTLLRILAMLFGLLVSVAVFFWAVLPGIE